MISARFLALAAFFMVSSTQAQAPIDLKSACNYLVLASSAITTNAASSFDGNFVIHPSTVGNIQNPGGLTVVTDEIYYQAYSGINGFVWGPGDATRQAHEDMMAAYTDGYTRAPTGAVDTRSIQLGGQSFTKGIYQWSSPCYSAARSVITLNGAKGDVFIFQMPTLTTGAQSVVNLVGGVTAESVFWVLASTLKLGSQSNFVGNGLVGSAATAGSQVVWDGAVFAQSAVTMGSSVQMTNIHAVCGTAPGARTAVTSSNSNSTASASSVSSSTVVSSSSAVAVSSSAAAPSSTVVSTATYTTLAPSSTAAAQQSAAPGNTVNPYNSYNGTNASSNSTDPARRWMPRGATWRV